MIKSTRIIIRVHQILKKAIAQAARKRMMTASEYVRQAIMEKLQKDEVL